MWANGKNWFPEACAQFEKKVVVSPVWARAATSVCGLMVDSAQDVEEKKVKECPVSNKGKYSCILFEVSAVKKCQCFLRD